MKLRADASWEKIQRYKPRSQIRHPNIPIEEAVEIVNRRPQFFRLLMLNPVVPIWDLSEPDWLNRLSAPTQIKIIQLRDMPPYQLVILAQLIASYINPFAEEVRRAIAACPDTPAIILRDLYLRSQSKCDWQLAGALARNTALDPLLATSDR